MMSTCFSHALSFLQWLKSEPICLKHLGMHDRRISSVSPPVVQGRQAAASVRRDLQKRYERCAEVAFGGRAAGKEAGYEVAPLETVVQVRMLHQQAMQWSNSRHHRHGLMPRNR